MSASGGSVAREVEDFPGDFEPAGEIEQELTGLNSTPEQSRAEQMAEETLSEALRQSEEHFRLLVENVIDYAIFMLDPQGHVMSWNAGAERIKGYRAEEILGQHFSHFYPEEDIRHGKPERELAIAKIEGRVEDEGWRLRKDGSRFWANVVITALYDQDRRLRGFAKLTRDITERKQIETELTEVQRRLMEGREAERLYLAQELHDGPVQELYGVVYTLSGLAEIVPGGENQAQFAEARELLQQVIHELRTMASELRPPTLAPFGLEKAISSHADRFRERYPEMEVRLRLMPDGQMLPERTRLALYRIYQAALNNVIHHAAARQVFIRFKLESKQVLLEIQDDGKGFEAPQRWIELARQGHLGLVGMAERAESVGGRLSVISAPGEGTLIQVIVPYLKEEA